MPRLLTYDAGSEWRVEVCPQDPCPYIKEHEERHRAEHFVRVWAKDVSRADAQRETGLLYKSLFSPSETKVGDRIL